jgi:DNA (cytosine-5)-methyltransferase 1
MGFKNIRPTYVSLYCGCGGFDEGFIGNGFNCLGAFDIDPVAINVYNNNIGPYGQVWDLSNGKLPYKITAPVDVVLSGSPCQGFSTVGKRELNDPRNNLLLVGGQIALKLKAKVFIAENVMGSTSGKHKIYWNKLEKMFFESGYQVKFVKCDVRKVGIPQLRKRILMIAQKGKLKVDVMFPDGVSRSLKDALSDVHEIPNHNVELLDKKSLVYKIALQIGPGQKLSNVRGSLRSVHTWNIPEVFGKTTLKERNLLLEIMRLRRRRRKRQYGDADPVEISLLKKMFGTDIVKVIKKLIQKGYLRKPSWEVVDLAHTFNGKYRRLSYDMPSPTVDTRFGSPMYFLHPEEHRPMSVREAARIQGFRDTFVFTGPIKNQYQMVGNAVPPPVSIQLAKSIKKSLSIKC